LRTFLRIWGSDPKALLLIAGLILLEIMNRTTVDGLPHMNSESTKEGKALTFRQWHHELRNLLIAQGLHGVRQTALLKHFKDEDEDELIGYLELLLKEDKAQKFKYQRHIYWRATTEILKEPV